MRTSQKTSETISTIGIDVGKNTFHLVGLDKRGVTYEFHDYKSAGIECSMLEGWARQAGWEALINRAGRTFRALPEKDQVGLTEKKAIALMAAQPSMIRRPVLDVGGKLHVGFRPEQYEKEFVPRR